jgi:hypothetical protein
MPLALSDRGGSWAMAEPLLLLLGQLLLRFAQRVLFALLFQLPPWMTRLEPFGRRPDRFLLEKARRGGRPACRPGA